MKKTDHNWVFICREVLLAQINGNRLDYTRTFLVGPPLCPVKMIRAAHFFKYFFMGSYKKSSQSYIGKGPRIRRANQLVSPNKFWKKPLHMCDWANFLQELIKNLFKKNERFGSSLQGQGGPKKNSVQDLFSFICANRLLVICRLVESFYVLVL